MSEPSQPNFLASNQATYNRSTRDHWDHFSAHRRQVSQMLVPDDIQSGGALCVLGAGNCNDLELPHLLSVFDRVTLVDIDDVALNAAVQRQSVAGHDRLDVRGGVDLTGVSAVMGGWPKRPPAAGDVDRCIRTLSSAPRPAIGGPFDVILSPCLLSQICLYATDTLGRSHPRTRDLRRAIRQQHLRQLVEWLSPGGTGILVIDLVTTDKLGSMLATHKDRLAEVASRTVGHARHFPGLDPESLTKDLLTDPMLQGMVKDVQRVPPWLWALGPHKSFLVYALRFRRSTTALL